MLSVPWTRVRCLCLRRFAACTRRRAISVSMQATFLPICTRRIVTLWTAFSRRFNWRDSI